MQKESFWSVKGVLLESKRGPFGMQKESFWRVKGALLESEMSHCDFD